MILDVEQLSQGFNICLLVECSYIYLATKQLPPVRDLALYNNNITEKSIYALGRSLFKNMDKYLFLNSSFRQNEQQQTFRDILLVDRISYGKVLIDDWKLLMTRSKQNLNQNEKYIFKNALRLFAQNDQVDKYNYKKLKQLNQPVVKINAKHNCEKAKIGSPQAANGLQSTLYISIGNRIMLKSNL